VQYISTTNAGSVKLKHETTLFSGEATAAFRPRDERAEKHVNEQFD